LVGAGVHGFGGSGRAPRAAAAAANTARGNFSNIFRSFSIGHMFDSWKMTGQPVYLCRLKRPCAAITQLSLFTQGASLTVGQLCLSLAAAAPQPVGKVQDEHGRYAPDAARAANLDGGSICAKCVNADRRGGERLGSALRAVGTAKPQQLPPGRIGHPNRPRGPRWRRLVPNAK
jgi:hypothetical protein